MKSTCTQCNEPFDFEPKTETIKAVDVTYAECQCGKRYLIHVQDKEVKDRLVKTNRLLKRFYDSSLSFAKRQKAWRKKQSFDERTREIMKGKEQEYSEIVNEVIG